MSLHLQSFPAVCTCAAFSRLASRQKRLPHLLAPVLAALALCGIAEAVAAPDQAPPQEKPKDVPADSTTEENSDPLARFKFGSAIGVSLDLMAGDPVAEAAVVNGVLRSSRTTAARPRVLLEVHRPFITFGVKPRAVKARLPESTARTHRVANQVVGISERAGWAVGPFAAIQSGGSSVVDGFAAGLMVSILRDASTGADFNIGVGAMLDEKVKFLGDGLVDGQALPHGETEVRFKEKAGWSFVLLFSIGQ